MKIYKCLNLNFTLLVAFLCIISSQSHAQVNAQRGDFWNKVRFGGNVGVSVGNGFFSGTLAPSAIYDFNYNFSMGLGLNGTYNSQKNVFNSTILGASIISLFNPLDQIQLSGEFEYLNVDQKFENNLAQDRNFWVPALFLGVGYRTNNVTVGIRYDVLYDRDRSIYADAFAPFFRVYF